MSNINKDVSTITTIPEKTLERLNEKQIDCICYQVKEDELNNIDISELDIGIGILYIKHADGELKYKFVPSTSLSKDLKDTLDNKLNSLEKTVNDALAKKFADVYKDLC